MKKASKAIPNQRLIAERMQHDWSQRQVAEQIGTTSLNVCRWERGLTSPSPHFRHKLCLLFKKNANELGLHVENIDASGEKVTYPLSHQTTDDFEFKALSNIWGIPYQRNQFFTGRKQFLTHLHNVLQTEKPTIITQAISGLTGVGKTETAIEYAHRYSDDYQAILWARAESRNTLISDFVNIASYLQLPEKNERDQYRVAQAVKYWLDMHSRWLLILDEVKDVEFLKQLLPTRGKGCILLTTQMQSTGTFANHINLEPMDIEEGTTFLLRRARYLRYESPLVQVPEAYLTPAQEICRLVNGLPLALDQAGSYIEETSCTLLDYLNLYRQHPTRLLSLRGGTNVNHPDSIFISVMLLFKLLEQIAPDAATLLKFCAFMHPIAIFKELVAEKSHESRISLQSFASDPIALNSAIAILRKYSFLHPYSGGETLAIHSIVGTILNSIIGG